MPLCSLIAFAAFSVPAAPMPQASAAQAKPLTKEEIDKKIGTARVWVCRTVNDDWQAVDFYGDAEKGEMRWPANKDFNILIVNPKPYKVSRLVIVIHKQKADGSDGEQVLETKTDELDDTTRKWCTERGLTYGGQGLAEGKYTVYFIDVRHVDGLEKKGMFREFFSRIVLTIEKAAG